MCGLPCWQEGCGEMGEKGFDYNTRNALGQRLKQQLTARMRKLTGQEKQLAQEIDKGEGYFNSSETPLLTRIIDSYNQDGEKKPSQWFGQRQGFLGKVFSTNCHQGILDAFVPKEMQASYLYIIDKLNQFPYPRGWNRRTIRTRGYGPQMSTVFALLGAYNKLFYCGTDIEAVIMGRLPEETLDYMRNGEYRYTRYFSYIYGAEIDLGNQKVIGALKELILSENNTAYLDREMILGILRSDNEELHQLLGSLLLAARLQEGLRQAICETMDEGCIAPFLLLLKTIEENDLIRFASVKRAVSSWIGIFDEKNVDRVNGKMLELMSRCLKDEEFKMAQLGSNDSIAISVALWATGFVEVRQAMALMEDLIDNGARNQKMTASFYNETLQFDRYKRRVAKRAILKYGEDTELAACFMPAFTSGIQEQMRLMFADKGSEIVYSATPVAYAPKKPSLTDFFEDRQEALALYERLWGLLKELPKKGVQYSPCIFPWYGVELKPGTVIMELALTAYVLGDEEKITAVAGLLGEIPPGYGFAGRSGFVNLLLYNPANEEQRRILVDYVGNAEEYTSNMARSLVSRRLVLDTKEYIQLEDMLRYKRSGLRKDIIGILMEQGDQGLEETLKRLIRDGREEKRTGALDILMQIHKEKERKDLWARVCQMPLEIENPTDRERILIEELTGASCSQEAIARENGYGIYSPQADMETEEIRPEKDVLKRCLPMTGKEIVKLINKLDDFVEEHKDYEYLAHTGEQVLVGNQFIRVKDCASSGFELDNYPLSRELREFYEKEIGSYEVFMEMEAMLCLDANAYMAGESCYKAVWGRRPLEPAPLPLRHSSQVNQIRLCFRYEFMDKSALFEESLHVMSALGAVANRKMLMVSYQRQGWSGHYYNTSALISQLPLLGRYFEGLGYWQTEEEFKKAFHTAYRFQMRCLEEGESCRFFNDRGNPITAIRVSWFLKAYALGMISRDLLLKAVMEYTDPVNNLRMITQFVKGEGLTPSNRLGMMNLFGDAFYKEMEEKGNSYMLEHSPEGTICRELYHILAPKMVDMELRRGDSETPYSRFINGITYIEGVDYLVRILMALGTDTLDRNTYYYWYGSNFSKFYTKKEVLSSLLKSCYPLPGEDAGKLKERLKGTSIKENRLVEAVMYAPQWIDIIEDYLGWKGLKSGCYYFMAHMDERFDDRKQAMIAKYTPLSPEELQFGAFDVNWFREAYGALGEKHFDQLYKAAKYSSDGQKHSRARKYADAASGKAKIQDLKGEITARRNKDLLMSLGLVPFGEDRERDMLERYQYFQQFYKESRRFGAQRRASEGKAVEMALTNLSVNAGFSDVTRLNLNMEARMAEQIRDYLEWRQVEDVEVKLDIGPDGKSCLCCRKGNKALKSIPSRLGKREYILALKEIHKKLKDQYSRTRKMMEESMESRTIFTAGEIGMLLGNPVAQAILKPLVFLWGQESGMAELEVGNTPALVLITLEGIKQPLSSSEELRIAHPLDLYRLGIWHEYQKLLFEQKIKQPFKQVFRELYVKLPEELYQKSSRMFAGNQIQPSRTVACLRDRRWVADYQEGLQKIYYKEDIIARIYALADWFSPSEAEAPTLEWVEFSNRRTFEPLTIEQVPDIIYSEVMRDVDLAVSVAHAGGVDPETSHSTIEMRRAIVEFNLPLFSITNVSLKNSHAFIKGTRGEYTVHLGSGVIHQAGGAMLNILPVHSQSRGRLFLPFIDEDPKTAEIMSKIVLLAEDKKIKDPFILDQICRNL